MKKKNVDRRRTAALHRLEVMLFHKKDKTQQARIEQEITTLKKRIRS